LAEAIFQNLKKLYTEIFLRALILISYGKVNKQRRRRKRGERGRVRGEHEQKRRRVETGCLFAHRIVVFDSPSPDEHQNQNPFEARYSDLFHQIADDHPFIVYLIYLI
jgi:hypothetical protein